MTFVILIGISSTDVIPGKSSIVSGPGGGNRSGWGETPSRVVAPEPYMRIVLVLRFPFKIEDSDANWSLHSRHSREALANVHPDACRNAQRHAVNAARTLE